MADFLWPPNWKSPVVERLEYLTDVQQSSNGTEVRIPLRTAPRSSLTFDIFAEGADAIRLRNFIQTNQGKKVMIPWWVNGLTWTDPSTSLLQVLSIYGVSPVDLAFTTDADGIWVDNGISSGLAKALQVSSTRIAISASGMPAGVSRQGMRIYPMIECYMNASTSLTAPTGNVLHGSITFEAVGDVPSGSASLPTQLGGVPVLIDEPNRSQDHTVDYNRMVSELDFMTGKRSHYDHSGQSFRTVSHEYALQEYKEIVPFKSFLNSLQGRKGSLYLPSFSCDFPNPSINFGYAPTSITHTDVGYRFLNPRPEAVWIQSQKGVNLFRNILGVSALSQNRENTTIETTTLISDSLHSVQILYKSRLATDSIEIVWHSSEVATISLPFRTLRT